METITIECAPGWAPESIQTDLVRLLAESDETIDRIERIRRRRVMERRSALEDAAFTGGRTDGKAR